MKITYLIFEDRPPVQKKGPALLPAPSGHPVHALSVDEFHPGELALSDRDVGSDGDAAAGADGRLVARGDEVVRVYVEDEESRITVSLD